MVLKLLKVNFSNCIRSLKSIRGIYTTKKNLIIDYSQVLAKWYEDFLATRLAKIIQLSLNPIY